MFNRCDDDEIDALLRKTKEIPIQKKKFFSELLDLAREASDEKAIFELAADTCPQIQDVNTALNELNKFKDVAASEMCKNLLLSGYVSLLLRLKSYTNATLVMNDALKFYYDLRKEYDITLNQNRSTKNFNTKRNREDLLKILTKSHEANVICFPFYGTLLGIERENGLMKQDKDLDVAVFTEDKRQLKNILYELGYHIPHFSYDTFTTFYSKEKDLTIDINTIRRCPESSSFVTGFISYDQPAEWQLVSELEAFEISTRELWGETIYYPSDANGLLVQLYGDTWSEVNYDWVNFLDEMNNKTSGLHCLYVKKNVLQYLKSKPNSYLPPLLERCVARYPTDHTFLYMQAHLGTLLRPTKSDSK